MRIIGWILLFVLCVQAALIEASRREWLWAVVWIGMAAEAVYRMSRLTK